MSVLSILCEMEDSLKTKETQNWAHPRYAGEETRIIDGHKVTIKVIGDGPNMSYHVGGKRVSFKKLCTILGI